MTSMDGSCNYDPNNHNPHHELERFPGFSSLRHLSLIAARYLDGMVELLSESQCFCHTRYWMQCGVQGKFRIGVGISPKALNGSSYRMAMVSNNPGLKMVGVTHYFPWQPCQFARSMTGHHSESAVAEFWELRWSGRMATSPMPQRSQYPTWSPLG